MAITTYNGPPGAGKSHALVKDVILGAVMAGRRVLSNVDGLNPNAVRAYCLEREGQWAVESADRLGEVIIFHGEDSQRPGFWPTEETEREGVQTTVRPGDLVVFDEWAMFWPTGDKSPAAVEVEKFMRWHRHLTHPSTGVACDLAIATQSITDFSRRHRPLITRSYVFKKLTAVGAAGQYTWHVYDGRLQKNSYQTGHGSYDKAIFPLYASSAAAGAGNHTELKTNKKESIWGGWKAKAFVASIPALGLFSVYTGSRAWADMGGNPKAESAVPVPVEGAAPAPGAAGVHAFERPSSEWRIVGAIEGAEGMRVIVADSKGATRMMKPDDFEFDAGRPVGGRIDGQRVVAEDRPNFGAQERESPFGGALY